MKQKTRRKQKGRNCARRCLITVTLWESLRDGKRWTGD